ncbi:MAG: ribonuclease III [Planctomycetota bacterium]
MREEQQRLDELQDSIGYEFDDISLLRKAITHSSLVPQGHHSYERLEFLGDAVSGLVIAEELFSEPAEYSEGEMTIIKSDTVNRHSMEKAGRRLELDQYLKVNDGLSDQKYPGSLLTDAYEAVVGAVFLDGGYTTARDFVLRTLAPELEDAKIREHTPNYKSVIQELLQAQGQEPPTYHTARKVGPDHNVRFQAEIRVDGVPQGSGWGRKKKKAEQEAAREALRQLYPDEWQDRFEKSD